MILSLIDILGSFLNWVWGGFQIFDTCFTAGEYIKFEINILPPPPFLYLYFFPKKKFIKKGGGGGGRRKMSSLFVIL